MATNEAASPAPSLAETGEYTHRQVLTILTGLLLGMFLGALDQTIVSTSIRTIADDLDGLAVQAWVTTAYLITSTIATPIYGKLGDLYGRKKLFMFAISVFIVGSVLCAFASTMYELAAFRAFQGIGAGGLFTLVLAIIGDIVSPRDRAKYTGYFMATFATSSVLGPVIGGFFAGQDEILGVTGWRWVFLVNVPVGLLALVVVYRTLHLSHHRRAARIDWWGAGSLVVALVPLLTVAEQGRYWGWGSARSVTAYVVGGLGLVAFYLAERAMGDDALIPLRLFRIRAASITILASIAIGIAMFGGILILPLYMQIVHGATPTEAGLLMLPMVVGMMSGAMVSGQLISRTGKTRVFPRIGSALLVVGLLLLSTTSADSPLVVIDLYMLVLGVGLGNCMQPLLLIMQSAVPPAEIGVATSSATFFRQIGGTVGVAVFLSVLFSTVGANIARELEKAAGTEAFQQVLANPTPADAAILGNSGAADLVQGDSSFIDTLSPALAHPFKAGFAESMDLVFLMGAAVGLVAFVLLLFMPKVELRATSAAVAARTAAGGAATTAPAAQEP
ncbi:MAG TPA: MDR family MFS transporter [Nocardioides sp.]|uniref:MDR family MFS transporter n=1 Tax=Nocardioides sp. TaxID=35761 RepID=UPI002E34DAA3|nr:MDR family MFS transporter [Nocardioides sp.]HEX5090603.1 MDR family MFS transporter [Nocardioides sp.]